MTPQSYDTEQMNLGPVYMVLSPDDHDTKTDSLKDECSL